MNRIFGSFLEYALLVVFYSKNELRALGKTVRGSFFFIQNSKGLIFMGAFSNFKLNDITWSVEIVNPNSPMLVDRTGKTTVATTDPTNYTVYLSKTLQGPFLIKVLLHELGHCVMVSYDLLDYIHSSVYPEKWVEAEEWVCNFIADYGFKIFSAAYKIVGKDAWLFIPQEIEKLVA